MAEQTIRQTMRKTAITSGIRATKSHLAVVLGFAVLALALVASPAYAQKAFNFGDILIKGEAQKPQVAFILPRSNKINLDVDIRRFKPTFSQQNRDTLGKYKKMFEIKE